MSKLKTCWARSERHLRQLHGLSGEHDLDMLAVMILNSAGSVATSVDLIDEHLLAIAGTRFDTGRTYYRFCFPVRAKPSDKYHTTKFAIPQ